MRPGRAAARRAQDEFWDDADEQAEEEDDTGLYDEAIAAHDRDLNAEAAQNDAELAAAAAARAKKAGAGMAEAKAAALAAVTAASAKPAREAAVAEAEAEFEAEGAAADAALAERAAAGAGADLPKPAGGEAGRPTAGATAHEAAAAELAEEEAKEEAAEEAAEDALEAAADAEASLDLPARLAKTAAAGKTKARPECHADCACQLRQPLTFRTRARMSACSVCGSGTRPSARGSCAARTAPARMPSSAWSDRGGPARHPPACSRSASNMLMQWPARCRPARACARACRQRTGAHAHQTHTTEVSASSGGYCVG